ncbi:Rv3654c family TadE-like protein [Brevibacterium sp. HMSC063G07]|uniref:Rv3654c family TadE-like protein n=1 Tax=Brevibacterium sp. HMSC063G07 TaxID=1739261 RepID=UPI000AB50FED|nr:Rv3654c family TadE-like protein [Brevibacterium sp. HMSC063G07]
MNAHQKRQTDRNRSKDRGSTPVIAVSIMGIAAVLIAGLGLTGRVLLVSARADGSADLAALAAADAARGTQPGEPCDVAKKLIEADGFTLDDCIARPDLGRVKITVKAKLPAPFPAVKRSAVAGGPQARAAG